MNMTRCYNSTRRVMDESRLAHYEAALEAAYETEIAIMSGTHESYRFDDGAGSQQKKEKALKDLRKSISDLEGQWDYYYRKLNGCLNVNIVQRRRLYRDVGFTSG